MLVPVKGRYEFQKSKKLFAEGTSSFQTACLLQTYWSTEASMVDLLLRVSY